MRSYWAKSFIQTITPSLDITLFVVILATILLMSFALQFNHRKELKQIVKYGSILIGIGVLIIFMGYTSLMDSLKYTEGGKKVTAQITKGKILIKGIRICAKVVKISDVSSEEPLCKLVCRI